MKNVDEKLPQIHPQSRRALWRRILLPRFSLRTMLVLLTLFCFAAAWVGNWIYRSEKQRNIVAYLNRFNEQERALLKRSHLNATDITYDFQSSEAEITKSRTVVPAFLRSWLGTDYFHDVVAIRINWSAVFHPDYPKMLDQLTNLSTTKFLTVHINADRFAEETFQFLNRLPKVEGINLELRYKKFTSADAARLRNISRLKRLRFDYCDGEELHLPLLSGLNQVEEFSIQLQGDAPAEVSVGEPLLGVKKVTIISHYRKYFNREYIAAMVKMCPNVEHFEVNGVDRVDILTPLKELKSLKVFETYDFDWKWTEVEAMLPGVKIKIWMD